MIPLITSDYFKQIVHVVTASDYVDYNTVHVSLHETSGLFCNPNTLSAPSRLIEPVS